MGTAHLTKLVRTKEKCSNNTVSLHAKNYREQHNKILNIKITNL